MSLWIGILASAGGLVGDFESIATVTVGSGGASTIEFTSIPATYASLHLRGVLRSSTAATNAVTPTLTVNGSAGTNYAQHELAGSGSAASAYGAADAAGVIMLEHPAAAAAANIFGAVAIDILDYASTSKYKTFRMFIGADRNGAGVVGLTSGLWKSTSAITTVTLTSPDNFVQHSTVALYGVKA